MPVFLYRTGFVVQAPSSLGKGLVDSSDDQPDDTSCPERSIHNFLLNCLCLNLFEVTVVGSYIFLIKAIVVVRDRISRKLLEKEIDS